MEAASRFAERSYHTPRDSQALRRRRKPPKQLHSNPDSSTIAVRRPRIGIKLEAFRRFVRARLQSCRKRADHFGFSRWGFVFEFSCKLFCRQKSHGNENA
jgi:hypothetical protein